MKAQPIPFVGGAYADETRPWSQQDTCNYLPCKAERAGARSDEMLKTPPGLKPFAEVVVLIDDDPDLVEYTPVRGIHEAEGRLFVVIGPTLYRMTSAGVAIPLGTVPGTGRVVMAHNQISLGNEILVVNGSAGYVYNTVTGVFARIDDPGYPGAGVAVFVDGYLVQVEPQGRYAFNSDVANATEYNTLDRFTSEVTPDRIVSLAVTGNELMLLNASSCEFFQNTGAAEQPFRSKRISFDKGCAGAYCVAQADNTVFWLGSDGSFYQLQGYTPVRISTRPIEQAIRGLDWSQAFAFVWDDAGHEVVYWTFPDGQTWGYDIPQQEWHRRESYGLSRWRVSGMAYWQNKWYAGDFQKGRIWELDWDYVLEGGQEFVSSRTIPVLHDNQSRILIPRVELVMDTGQPVTVPLTFGEQPEGPTISGDAPAGVVGEAYTYTYTTADGTAPRLVSLSPGSGPLPTGLTLSGAGVLSGTPTAAGMFSWSVRVTDANGLYADLADDATMVAETALTWFAGPLDDGMTSLLYVKASTPLALTTETPIALPAQGSGALERISVANGKVFMHRATTACMSADKGATWTACDNSLFGSSWGRDVYWNGTKYYYGGVTSSDGLAWTAIPNLPSGARVQFARASDGLILVQDAAGVTYTSDDAGATWDTKVDIGSSYTPPMATDGERIAWSTTAGLGYYSDDDMATVAGAYQSPTYGHHYSNGTWLKYQTYNGALGVGDGLVRSTTGSNWPADPNPPDGMAFYIDGVDLSLEIIGTDGTNWLVSENVADTVTLYLSADAGVTWGAIGTLEGPVKSHVAVSNA